MDKITKKESKSKEQLLLAGDCQRAAIAFIELLKKDERPVTMVLYRKPELRSYGKKKINYQYPLYRFFQQGTPNIFLLEQVKELTEVLKKERKK